MLTGSINTVQRNNRFGFCKAKKANVTRLRTQRATRASE